MEEFRGGPRANVVEWIISPTGRHGVSTPSISGMGWEEHGVSRTPEQLGERCGHRQGIMPLSCPWKNHGLLECNHGPAASFCDLSAQSLSLSTLAHYTLLLRKDSAS